MTYAWSIPFMHCIQTKKILLFSSLIAHQTFLMNCKDLGIFYSSSLSFEHRISVIIRRALGKMLGFIKRMSIAFASPDCAFALFTLLLPLEYIYVWCSCLASLFGEWSAKNRKGSEQVGIPFLFHLFAGNRTS